MALKALSWTVQVWVYGIDPTNATLSNGNAVLSVTDSLVLGATTRGKIGAVAANKLREDYKNPRNLTSYVESVSIKRGRRRSLDSFEAGTATITLEDKNKTFDPLNTSALGGSVLDSPRNLLRRGRAIRVVVIGSSDNSVTCRFALFSGYIDSIVHDYAPTTSTTMSRTTIQCVDAFALAAAVDRNEADLSYGAGETMGPRVRRWAEAAGLMAEGSILSARGLRYYTTYSSGVQTQPSAILTGYRYGVCGDEGTHTLQSTTLSENALTGIKRAVATEDGWVYVNRDGQIVHRSRAVRSAAWTFADILYGSSTTITGLDIGGGDSISFSGDAYIQWEGMPSIRTDTTDVANYVALARTGGSQRVACDSSSIDEIGRVSYGRTDLLNETDADVDTCAQALVGRHGGGTKTIISGLRIRPGTGDMALWFLCSAELTEKVHFYGSTWGIDMYLYISGIDIDIPFKYGLIGSTVTVTLTEAD